jgi:hypothetical protein
MTQRSEKVQPPSREALALGYEPEVIRRRAMVILLAYFVVMAVVLHIFLWALMTHYISRDRAVDYPASVVEDDAGPPPPWLQPSVQHDAYPYEDAQRLHAEDDQMFAHLGWLVNANTHELKIPEAIVSRVAREAQARAAGPATLPTASPRGVNTYEPGPPPPGNTHQNGGSPQGPTPNLLPDPGGRIRRDPNGGRRP